jgi:ankyrin repeat protein
MQTTNFKPKIKFDEIVLFPYALFFFFLLYNEILFRLQTPLHLAVLNGNADITQILISFGAQPSVKDRNGNTALHLAVLYGNLHCLKVILNTNNTESLPLDDFNDEGKYLFCILTV